MFDPLQDIFRDASSAQISLVVVYAFVLVTGTVASVLVAQNRLIAHTKQDVQEGFDKVARRLDRRFHEKKKRGPSN